MSFLTALNVKIENTPAQVTGGDFWAMKKFVSDWERWPGRKWDGANKMWELPRYTTLTTFREAVEAEGWQLLLSEAEKLDAEIATIEELQNRVLWNSVEIQYRADQLQGIVSQHSYNSSSRKKVDDQAASGCFHYSLKYAEMPLEQLTEPQIATLKASLRRLDEFNCIPLAKLISYFSIEPETFAEKMVPLSSVNMAGVPKRGDDYCVEKYACDLAVQHNLNTAFLPNVTLAERFSPLEELTPVVVFQLKE